MQNMNPAALKAVRDAIANDPTIVAEAAGGPNKPPNIPKLGDPVHYVLDEGTHAGEHRAAIVTNSPATLVVNLFVIADIDDDLLSGGRCLTTHVRCVTWDETGRRPGSWHWPEQK